MMEPFNPPILGLGVLVGPPQGQDGARQGLRPEGLRLGRAEAPALTGQ